MLSLLPHDIEHVPIESFAHLENRYAKKRPILTSELGQDILIQGKTLSAIPPEQRLATLWKPWLSLLSEADRETDSSGETVPMDLLALQAAVDGWFTELVPPGAAIKRPTATIGLPTPLGIWLVRPGERAVSLHDLRREAISPSNTTDASEIGLTIHVTEGLAVPLTARLVEPGVEGATDSVLPLTIESSEPDEIASSQLRLVQALTVLSEIGVREWVTLFLSNIVPLHVGSTYSGRYSVSAPDVYGSACIDARGSLVDIIESLVHEASHQAFYLHELGRPLIREYVMAPSPFRSGLRTLRRVLAGAHAFSNSLLVLRALQQHLPVLMSNSDSRLDFLQTRVAAALRMLDGHASLTPDGQSWVDQMIENHGVDEDKMLLSDLSIRGGDVSSAPEASEVLDDAVWGWRSSKMGWFNLMIHHLSKWQPHPRLQLDSSSLRECLLDGAGNQEEWIYHPCISPLTTADDAHIQRDLQLAVWVAIHSTRHLGSVYIPERLWVWSPDGGFPLSPGTYELRELATMAKNTDIPEIAPNWIALDVWSDSIGGTAKGGWASLAPLSLAYQAQLRQDILVFFGAVRTLENRFPACAAWISDVTRVAIPLAAIRRNSLQSGSRKDIPGLVFMDLFGGEVSALELLVHESAHLHLFLAEAEGPLVEPSHRTLYWSPLRHDPRPLRGILLAYHALAYMLAFYRDMVSENVATSESEKQLSELRLPLELSESTLEAARDHLTTDGRSFLNSTQKVANYAKG